MQLVADCQMKNTTMWRYKAQRALATKQQQYRDLKGRLKRVRRELWHNLPEVDMANLVGVANPHDAVELLSAAYRLLKWMVSQGSVSAKLHDQERALLGLIRNFLSTQQPPTSTERASPNDS